VKSDDVRSEGGGISPNGTTRYWLYQQLEPSAWPRKGLSPVNVVIVGVILIGTVAAILQTEPLLLRGREQQFLALELSLGLFFAVEYLARLWVASLDPGSSSTAKRVRFIFSFSGLLDLAIILSTFAPFLTINLIVLRLVRLLRIVRLAKLGRMSLAIKRLSKAVGSRKYELLFTMGLAVTVLVFGATALHIIEGELQPDKFGSIPRAMWWSVVTLTTIGYGDVYPITVLGKIFAAVVAVAGIGLIAMPTGILASAFSEAVRDEEPETEI
jgi:voltage-gated potassium channel